MKDKEISTEQEERLVLLEEWGVKVKTMTREQIEEAILMELSEIRKDIRKLVEKEKASKQLKNETSNYNSEPF